MTRFNKYFFTAVALWLAWTVHNAPVEFIYKLLLDILFGLLILQWCILIDSLSFIKKVSRELPGYVREILK